MALTCTDLDAAGCDTPDCGHDHSVLYLIPACHPQAGSSVSYSKVTRTMALRCKRCATLIAEVAVAPGTLH